jgi:VanZ family protein
MFSAGNTGSWLRPLFERVFGRLTDSSWDTLHFCIRKTGHFSGFGLVCLTFLRGWLLTLAARADFSISQWRTRSSLLAVFSTAVVASLDEWHQTFLPSRTGKVTDVGIDTSGALLACFLVWFFCWRRSSNPLSAISAL